MSPLACPHCQQPCVTAWSKLSLGPGRTRTCPSCHRRFSVSWWPSVAAMLFTNIFAFAVGMLLLTTMAPASTAWSLATLTAGMVTGSLPGLWVYCRFVPLVRRP